MTFEMATNHKTDESCLQRISQHTESAIGSYDFYLIHSTVSQMTNQMTTSWVIGPHRSAWIPVNDESLR